MMPRIEPTFNEPVTSETLFVGRSELLAYLVETRNNPALIGEARVGKSSVLREFCRVLRDQGTGTGRPIFTTFLNLRGPLLKSPSDVIGACLKNTIAQTRSVNDELATSLEFATDGTGGATDRLLRYLEEMSGAGVSAEHIFVLDNLDDSNFRRERSFLYSSLRKIIDYSPASNHVRLVCSARPGFMQEQSAVVSDLVQRLTEFPMEALSEADLVEMVRLAGLLQESWGAAALDNDTAGHPCLAQEVLVRLAAHLRSGTLERAAYDLARTEIVEQGGNFFRAYVAELAERSLADLFYLQALAVAEPGDQLTIPSRVLQRLSTAGLVRQAETDGSKRCSLFLGWLRKHMHVVTDTITRLSPGRLDPAAIAELIVQCLPSALQGWSVRSEMEIHRALQALLAAHQIDFEREFSIRFAGKNYRIDFVAVPLRLAIEVKLVKRTSKVGAVIDQVAADLEAYRSRFDRLLVLIYDLTGEVDLAEFTEQVSDPLTEIILVRAP